MNRRKISKSALAMMMVAGGLLAAAPALTTPAFGQCGGTKAVCNPCAAKKGNPCAAKKKAKKKN